MTDKKDDLPNIGTLRPIDDSASAIRSAMARLTAARRENTAEIAKLTEARPQLLLSGTAAEIDRNDQTIRKRNILFEQFDLLEPELRKMAGAAQLREEDEEYTTRLAEVEERARAFNAKFRVEYPAWCAAIRPLLAEEKEITSQIVNVTAMPGASRVKSGFTDNTYYTLRIMVRAGAGTYSKGMSFGSAIVLPPIPEDAP